MTVAATTPATGQVEVLSKVRNRGHWTSYAYHAARDRALIHTAEGYLLVRGEERVAIGGGRRDGRWLHFSPDGRWAALSVFGRGKDSLARLEVIDLDAEEPAPRSITGFLRHRNRLEDLRWTHDSQRLYVFLRPRDPSRSDEDSILWVPNVEVPWRSHLRYSVPMYALRRATLPKGQRALVTAEATDGHLQVRDERGKLAARVPLPWKDRRYPFGDLEWSPNPAMSWGLLVSTRHGMWILDGARALEGSSDALFQISEERSNHTTWASPKGSYASWTTREGIWIREPRPDAETRLLVAARDVHGFAWRPDERAIAYTVGGELRLVDVASGETRPLTTLSECGFAANPRWVGGRVFASVWEEVSRAR